VSKNRGRIFFLYGYDGKYRNEKTYYGIERPFHEAGKKVLYFFIPDDRILFI